MTPVDEIIRIISSELEEIPISGDFYETCRWSHVANARQHIEMQIRAMAFWNILRDIEKLTGDASGYADPKEALDAIRKILKR